MGRRCAWTGKRRGLPWKFRRRSNGGISVWNNICRRDVEYVESARNYWTDFLSVLCVPAVNCFWRLGKIERGADGFRYVGYLLHGGGGHFFAGAAFTQD